MKIVVIGGTGLIGTKVVKRLRDKGYEVMAASPDSGVNTITGEGLAEALAGAKVVIDLANSPSFEDSAVLKFFETSGQNLLAAEAAAGVQHHVALSIVGTDRLPDSGYLRAKMAQERLIKTSTIPYTSSAPLSSSNSWEASPNRRRWGKRFACRPPWCSPSCPTTWPTPSPMLRSARRSKARLRSQDRNGHLSTKSSAASSLQSKIRARSSPIPMPVTSARSSTIDRSHPATTRILAQFVDRRSPLAACVPLATTKLQGTTTISIAQQETNMSLDNTSHPGRPGPDELVSSR
jgi:hypothetical protein